MKPGLLIPLFLLLASTDVYSQRIQDPALSTELSIKQYDILAEGYYGFPFLTGLILKQMLEDSVGITDVHILNHLGLRAEYMLWGRIGLGVEYTYALLSVNYQATNAQYYTAGIAKQRLLGKFNFHFSTTKKADPYLTAGIGYNSTTLFSDEPGVQKENVSYIPVASRIGIGLRYFFTETVGMHIEAGIGGPLAQVGFSIKI